MITLRASDCTGQTTTFVGDVRVLNTPNTGQLQGRESEGVGGGGGGRGALDGDEVKVGVE